MRAGAEQHRGRAVAVQDATRLWPLRPEPVERVDGSELVVEAVPKRTGDAHDAVRDARGVPSSTDVREGLREVVRVLVLDAVDGASILLVGRQDVGARAVEVADHGVGRAVRAQQIVRAVRAAVGAAHVVARIPQLFEQGRAAGLRVQHDEGLVGGGWLLQEGVQVVTCYRCFRRHESSQGSENHAFSALTRLAHQLLSQLGSSHSLCEHLARARPPPLGRRRPVDHK